jgi:hypothetical protein
MPAILRSGRTAAAVLAIVLACALSACATTSKCGASGCEGDARIKEQVEDVIHQNQAIQPWSITVQAIDGVVYLYGTVDTGLQRNVLEEEAAAVPGSSASSIRSPFAAMSGDPARCRAASSTTGT